MASLLIRILGDSSGFNSAVEECQTKAESFAETVETTIDRAEGSISSSLIPSVKTLGDAFTETSTRIESVSESLKGLEKGSLADSISLPKPESLEVFIDTIVQLSSDVENLGNTFSSVGIEIEGVTKKADDLCTATDKVSFPSEIADTIDLIKSRVGATTSEVDTLNNRLESTSQKIMSIIPDLRVMSTISSSGTTRNESPGSTSGSVGREGISPISNAPINLVGETPAKLQESLDRLYIPELILSVDTSSIDNVQESLDSVSLPELSVSVNTEALDSLLEESNNEIPLTFVPQGIEEIQTAIDGLRATEEVLIPVEQAGSTWTIQEQIDALHGKTVVIPVEAQVDNSAKTIQGQVDNSANTLAGALGDTSSFTKSLETSQKEAKDFSNSLDASLGKVQERSKGVATSIGTVVGSLKSLEGQGEKVASHFGVDLAEEEEIDAGKLEHAARTMKEFGSTVETSVTNATGAFSKITESTKSTTEAIGNLGATFSKVASSAGLEKISAGLSSMTGWLAKAATGVLAFAGPIGILVGAGALIGMGIDKFVGWVKNYDKLREAAQKAAKEITESMKSGVKSVIEDIEDTWLFADRVAKVKENLELATKAMDEATAAKKKWEKAQPGFWRGLGLTKETFESWKIRGIPIQAKAESAEDAKKQLEDEKKRVEDLEEQLAKIASRANKSVSIASARTGDMISEKAMSRVAQPLLEMGLVPDASIESVQKLADEYQVLGKLKELTQVEKIIAQMEKMGKVMVNKEAADSLRKTREALDSIGLTKPELAVRELNKELDKLIKKTPEGSKEIDDLKKKIDGIKNVTVAKDLKELGNKTNIEIETSGLSEVEKKVYELKKSIANLGDNPEARARLIGYYNDMAGITQAGISKMQESANKEFDTAGMTDIEKRMHEIQKNIDAVSSSPELAELKKKLEELVGDRDVIEVNTKQIDEAKAKVDELSEKAKLAFGVGPHPLASRKKGMDAFREQLDETFAGLPEQMKAKLQPVMDEWNDIMKKGEWKKFGGQDKEWIKQIESVIEKLEKAKAAIGGGNADALKALANAQKLKDLETNIQTLRDQQALIAGETFLGNLKSKVSPIDLEIKTIGMDESEKYIATMQDGLEKIKAAIPGAFSPEQIQEFEKAIGAVANQINRFEGAKLTEKFMLPEEKFSREKARLDEMLKSGFINMRTYSAAVADAGKSLDKTQQSAINLTSAIAGSGAGVKQVSDYFNELEAANIKAASSMFDTSPNSASNPLLPSTNATAGDSSKDVVSALGKIEALLKMQLKKEPVKVNVVPTNFDGV